MTALIVALSIFDYLECGVLVARYIARVSLIWCGDADALTITLFWPLVVMVHILGVLFTALSAGWHAIGRLILRGVKK